MDFGEEKKPPPFFFACGEIFQPFVVSLCDVTQHCTPYPLLFFLPAATLLVRDQAFLLEAGDDRFQTKLFPWKTRRGKKKKNQEDHDYC